MGNAQELKYTGFNFGTTYYKLEKLFYSAYKHKKFKYIENYINCNTANCIGNFATAK